MPAAAPDRPTLRAGSATLEVSPADGGRVSRLIVDGRDVLVRSADTTIGWGLYAMIPWAGRLRDGLLRWRGREWRLPQTAAPHAIHGTLLWQPWRVIGGGAGGGEIVLGADLSEPWPFGGRAVQRLSLAPDGLVATIEVHATREPMPVIVGWHPWFVRRLRADDGAESAPVELDLQAGGMLATDVPGIPTGELVAPTPGPWDDTFRELTADPVVRWPGALELTINAPDATDWVIYTADPQGICVEPQTGPPNGLNGGSLGTPGLVEPGRALTAMMTWRWRRAG